MSPERFGRVSEPDASPLKVAHLTARLVVGGMENVVASLLRAMPASRVSSSAWCLEEADVIGDALRAEGRDVFAFGKRHARDPSLFLRIAARIRRTRTRILHCHDELAWFYGAIGARLAGGCRVIMTMHGRRHGISSRHLIEQRLLAALTSVLVCVSAYLEDQLLRELHANRSRLRIIRNGISLPPVVPGASERAAARSALGLSPGTMAVGWSGRMAPVKNLDLLLRSFAGLVQHVPESNLVLFGDGPEAAALDARAAELGISGRVLRAGVRLDLPKLLPALDAYACSSHYEGLSLSVLEAMAAGIPVVATAVGGNPELLGSGDSGLLVPPGDADAMEAALRILAEDGGLRRRMGECARQRIVENFSIDRMIDDYLLCYRSIVPRDLR